MNIHYAFRRMSILAVFSIFSIQCKEDEEKGLPIMATLSINNIAINSANSGGFITSDGGAAVVGRGVCWSTEPGATIELDTKTTDGSGVGSYTSNISGLTPGTTYYVRAYATNSQGTVYGNELSFKTLSDLSVLTTTVASDITSTSAVSGGTVVTDGGATITSRGICWSTTVNPTIALTTKSTDGSGIGSYTSNISGLTPGTTYYVRAYASNGIGTAYGNEISFTTNAVLPKLTTSSVSNILATVATSGGNVTDNGGAPVTARGVCWSINPNPTVDLSTKTVDTSGTGNFTSSITGLTSLTTYYVRAYATNSQGTAYGNEVSFTTIAVPQLTTASITNISAISASSGGTIAGDGGSAVVARGICWSTSPNPTADLSTKTTDGSGTGTYTSTLTGLTSGVTYYVRAYAINAAGTGYGNELSFTANGLSVTDVDGNVYRMVQIGTQTWMKENLKTTHYRDGSLIPQASSASDFVTYSSGVYIVYNNAPHTDPVANNLTYGKFYNYYAVSDPRKLCPAGTHIPSDTEWETLITYAGGNTVAGGKLKEAGTAHWLSANATDDYGFTALPGGSVAATGVFSTGIVFQAGWWTSTEASASNAYHRQMITYNATINGSPTTGSTGEPKNSGYFVRCIQD